MSWGGLGWQLSQITTTIPSHGEQIGFLVLLQTFFFVQGKLSVRC